MVSTEEVVATDSVNMISYYEQFLGCNIDSIPHIANYQKESKKSMVMKAYRGNRLISLLKGRMLFRWKQIGKILFI